MVNYVNTGIDVRTVQTNCTTKLIIQNNESNIILLPSLLTNTILNFNFELNGNPVVSGMTGSIVLSAQYLNGRITSLGTINLMSPQSNMQVNSKYTQINVAVSGLSGVDTIIIYADQNINII